MTYDCQITSSIEDVDRESWDLVCESARSGIALDRRFIAAAERSLEPSSRFWHVLVRDDEGQPVACTSLSTYALDLAPLTDPRVGPLVRLTQRLAPRALVTRVLFCGLPVFFGMTHLAFARNTAREPILERLDALTRELGRAEKADLVVFREFDPAGRMAVKALLARGYRVIDTPAMYRFRPKAPSFEDYCGSLKSRYRHEIKRVWRKFENAGFTHERTNDPAAIARLYTPEVHALYEGVASTAELKVGSLPPTFVPELARSLPGQVSLALVRKAGRPVGQSCTLIAGSTGHFLFCGFDRELNREGEIYFNIVYRDLAHAMSLGTVDEVEVGQTANFFKTRLGCDPEPRAIFVRPARLLPALALPLAFRRFLGQPKPELGSRHIYREPALGS